MDNRSTPPFIPIEYATVEVEGLGKLRAWSLGRDHFAVSTDPGPVNARIGQDLVTIHRVQYTLSAHMRRAGGEWEPYEVYLTRRGFGEPSRAAFNHARALLRQWARENLDRPHWAEFIERAHRAQVNNGIRHLQQLLARIEEARARVEEQIRLAEEGKAFDLYPAEVKLKERD